MRDERESVEIVYMLYLYCTLDPSSPSSSPQVTEALKWASFYINRTKGFQSLARYADSRHVGNWHRWCRQPTLGLSASRSRT